MSAAPPFWQVDIQKRLAGEFFTNVYHVARSSQSAAKDMAIAIVALERSFHSTEVQFLNYRVRPFPGPAEGTTYPIGLAGNTSVPNYLSLFNVCRVDFPAPTGRPSRKFYRLPIDQSSVVDGVLIPALVASIQSLLDAFFASPDSAGLIDVDGQLLTEARVLGPVAMRQLRRGSKRRLIPVIPLDTP